MSTAGGDEFVQWPARGGAPTLLLFAWSGADTLTKEPYRRVGSVLYERGWSVVSLDLPCHGGDRRAGEPAELAGWAARAAAGEDFVAPFRQRVNAVVNYLVTAGIADPSRIAAAGTSRGGYMAFHAAAGNPLIRAVAAFAPVTDISVLTEFAGQETNPVVQRLALLNVAAVLADRPAWITIGNADTRVSTDKAVAFAGALKRVKLRVVGTPGHNSPPEWYDEAAEWLERF